MCKDETERKNHLDDIKTLFDGIKHLALVVSLALGIPYLQDLMTELGLLYRGRAYFNMVMVCLILLLTYYAFKWLALNFKSKPWSAPFHWFSFFVLAGITIATAGSVIYQQYENVAFKFW